jgi:hypothetical protein
MPRGVAAGVAIFTGFCAIWYLFLLGNGHLTVFAPEQMDRLFGDMARHLSRGEFTVDLDALGSESFTRDGKTYAYFGIFPAVLRLILSPFIDTFGGGLARLSCWVAMVLYVAILLATLAMVHRSVPAQSRSGPLLAIMIAAIGLSGPEIYLLGSAWVFHEPLFWSAVAGAGFNFVLLRSVLAGRRPGTGDLAALAVLAGIALNTRASVGAGLCVAIGLLLIWSAWMDAGASGVRSAGTFAAACFRWRIVAPVLLLGFFVVVVCVVNFERWGNPLKFADFRYYDFARRQPWRMNVIVNQGELSPSRIWVSALYYATGIPYLLKNTVTVGSYLKAHFDGLEAPPMSGLIVNPLIVILAGFGLHRLLHRPRLLSADATAILSLALFGHFVAVVLVCSAMYLAMRYRLDFAPFMTLAMFIGYPAVSERMTHAGHRRGFLGGAVAICLFGVIASHYALVIHKVWSPGVERDVRLKFLPFAPFARAALDQ